MAKAAHSAMPARMRLLLLAPFFQGFVLWYAVEKLFMRSIGFDAQAVALETIIFTVIMALANVPLGVLADRWSRKGVLMLASCILILSSVVCGSSHGFWLYVVGACLWGIYFACYGGMYDSITYDLLLEEQGNAKEFERYYGRIQIMESLALVIGSLASSVVTHFMGLRANFFVTVPISLCSLIVLYFFREPTVHKKEAKGSVSAQFRDTFRAVRSKGSVLWIVVSLVLVTLGMRFVFEFSQLWLVALALPAVLFGPVSATLLAGCGVGGWIAGKLKDSRLITGAIGGLVFVASLALLVHSIPLIIGGELLILGALITLNVIISRYLHDSLPSKVRAGASSVVVATGYASFLPLAALFGAISNRHSVFGGAWVLVAIAAITGSCVTGMLIALHKVPHDKGTDFAPIQEYPK